MIAVVDGDHSSMGMGVDHEPWAGLQVSCSLSWGKLLMKSDCCTWLRRLRHQEAESMGSASG